MMKKGVPIREDKNSMVEQVPDDLMGNMIRGLAELAEKNRAENQRPRNEQSDGWVKRGMRLHFGTVLITLFWIMFIIELHQDK